MSGLAVGSPLFGVPRGSLLTNLRRDCYRERQPGYDGRGLPRNGRPHFTTRRSSHADIRLGRPDRNCSCRSRIAGQWHFVAAATDAVLRRPSYLPPDMVMAASPDHAPAMALNDVVAVSASRRHLPANEIRAAPSLAAPSLQFCHRGAANALESIPLRSCLLTITLLRRLNTDTSAGDASAGTDNTHSKARHSIDSTDAHSTAPRTRSRSPVRQNILELMRWLEWPECWWRQSNPAPQSMSLFALLFSCFVPASPLIFPTEKFQYLNNATAVVPFRATCSRSKGAAPQERPELAIRRPAQKLAVPGCRKSSAGNCAIRTFSYFPVLI